jgi:hypothetical protein
VRWGVVREGVRAASVIEALEHICDRRSTGEPAGSIN